MATSEAQKKASRKYEQKNKEKTRVQSYRRTTKLFIKKHSKLSDLKELEKQSRSYLYGRLFSTFNFIERAATKSQYTVAEHEKTQYMKNPKRYLVVLDKKMKLFQSELHMLEKYENQLTDCRLVFVVFVHDLSTI